ncbi:hypothetical protein H2248_003199 [Termitomyces sp. 'cryptogamus']|nr:hypothetical protein H2248_003199 [Termitomyces sp. 'cryptogamus']
MSRRNLIENVDEPSYTPSNGRFHRVKAAKPNNSMERTSLEVLNIAKKVWRDFDWTSDGVKCQQNGDIASLQRVALGSCVSVLGKCWSAGKTRLEARVNRNSEDAGGI